MILDLDDTTITTPEGQWLGRSDMFYDLLAREQEKSPDKSKVDLAGTIDPLLMSVYRKVPVIVTDKSLPSVVNKLINQGISVIAMTSRGQKIRDVTLEQLERVGLRFSDLGSPRWVNLDEKRQFRIERNGVVFVSHGNKKGEVLTHLLKDGFFNDKEHIYLIDDRERHLSDVKKAIEGYSPDIKFTPVLCTYLDDKEVYDSLAANRQLMHFLMDNKEMPEIKHLINNDFFTKQIANDCLSVLPDKKKECLAIIK